MKKKYTAISMGEALVDFIPLDSEVCGKYKAVVGGAPLNVAVGLARLTEGVGLIARVGEDPLGGEILATLEGEGVDCSFVQRDKKRHTPITVVLPNAADTMRYIIYRENTADNAIDLEKVPPSLFSSTYVFHVGTLLSATEKMEQTVLKALQLAKQGGSKISLDVNLRLGCWASKEDMVRATLVLMEHADIIKATKAELDMLNINLEDYIKRDKVLLVTDGSRTAYAYWRHHVVAEPVPSMPAVDVTGAGDAFMSAFLYSYTELLKAGLELDEARLSRCLTFGVRAGSFAVQKYGAHTSFPTKRELLNWLD